MGRRLHKFRGAALLGLVLGLSGCDAIPMGTGEYLTEDGDGEAAVRELAVRSVEIGAEASGVPGWMLYEREPYVRDCRSIYQTGNIVAYSGIWYQLEEPTDEDALFARVLARIKADGGIAIVQEVNLDEPDGYRILKAKNGRVSFSVSTTNDASGLVTDFRVLASSVCVKPDGEIINDFRSRLPEYFKDAS